jgi:hypothetical protein
MTNVVHVSCSTLRILPLWSRSVLLSEKVQGVYAEVFTNLIDGFFIGNQFGLGRKLNPLTAAEADAFLATMLQGIEP